MTHDPTIVFTPIKYLRLKAQYLRAVREGMGQFTFTDDDGSQHELDTKYAKYMLEYLAFKMGDTDAKAGTAVH